MKRIKLSHTIIAVCMATTSLAGAKAYADNSTDVYFYPKNKWVVERLSQASSDAPPSCALSNQLNNGYIVQIAGTQNGMTNINLDVRQEAFSDNKPYEVVYSIPGQEKKILPTRAFGSSLLVSDLRNAQEFSEKLTDASVMDISIQGNEFRIYLTGLNASMAQYSDCIAPAGQAMAQGESAPAAIIAPPQPEIALQDNQAPPPPRMMMSAPKAQQSAKAPAQLDPNIVNRKRYTEQLSERLKEESEKYKSPDAAQSAPQIIDDNASALSQDETSLEPATGKSVEKYTTPAAKYNVYKSEKTLEADFTAQAPEPEQVVASVEPASGGNNDEFIQMRNKISELEKTLSTLRTKNEMLDGELKSALRDAEEERLSVSSDNWNLERATMRFNEAERQVERLGRQLQTQRAQCQMEKSELETMLFDPQLTQQQQLAKLNSLEQELDKAEAEMYMQKRQYEERIRILQEQLEGN